ncbi:recombinase family protein [Amylibacter sp.]|nr:recombinase family protein [Amylibacter sp.]
MTKKVCLYVRVSTKEQSCERQLIELRELCSNLDYTIVGECIDDILRNRPALDRMLKDAMT